MTEPIQFNLNGDHIELFKLLKLTGLCESGGAAKYAIAEGRAEVDGVVESRKAFKVRRGQCVEFEGTKILVQ